MQQKKQMEKLLKYAIDKEDLSDCMEERLCKVGNSKKKGKEDYVRWTTPCVQVRSSQIRTFLLHFVKIQTMQTKWPPLFPDVGS